MTDPTNSGAGDIEDNAERSVGDCLRIGREAHELAVQDVATRLRLGINTIRALEASRFDDLAPSAYVRGYIRNYARLLETDPEPLLRQFDASASDAPPVRPYADSRPATQASSSDSLVKAVTYAVVAILVILLGIWWQTQYRENPISADDEELTARAIRSPAEQSTDAPAEAIAPAIAPFKSALTAPANEPAVSPDSTAGQDIDALLQSSPIGMPDALHPEPTTAETFTGTQDFEAISDEISSDRVTAALPQATSVFSSTTAIDMELEQDLAPDVLVLRTLAEAWVEIYDANETKLHYDLVPAGRRIEVKGERPYRLRIGNFPAVVVQYQDTILDLTPFSINGIARFRVGANGAEGSE